MPAPRVRVLMVCLGNICRSPSAHGVFEALVARAGLGDQIAVDSAGTGDWHIGASPDQRAQAAALKRGYDLSNQRARQVSDTDFERFDYLLAMDRTNLKDLRARCPQAHRNKLHLLLEFADTSHEAVPDPYYSGEEGFELVLDLVETACAGLLAHVRAEHDLQPRPASTQVSTQIST
jgi:protein-tyrosine phosphatase